MKLYEIELFEPMAINGRPRDAGYKGVTTSSYVKLMQRAGAGRVLGPAPEGATTDAVKAPVSEKPKAKAKPKDATE